jgi:hypothetical protein
MKFVCCRIAVDSRSECRTTAAITGDALVVRADGPSSVRLAGSSVEARAAEAIPRVSQATVRTRRDVRSGALLFSEV